MSAAAEACVFCRIVAGSEAARVLEDEDCIGFLDRRPVFLGHTLIVPRGHHSTLQDVPAPLLGRLFTDVQLVTEAVERALGADGAWIAVNNKVSQSVPHVHVHVVPRRSGDGLKGFFWPRQRYASDAQMQETAISLRKAVAELRQQRP